MYGNFRAVLLCAWHANEEGLQTMKTYRHDDVEKLAYKLWERRGRPTGSPEVDWHAAERALRDSQELLLVSVRTEPDEGPYREP